MREQTFQHLALLRLARDDCDDTVVGLDRLIAHVEPQAGFTMLRVLTVAVEAVLREDRPDVAVEADVLGGEGTGHGEEGEDSTWCCPYLDTLAARTHGRHARICFTTWPWTSVRR